MPKNYYAILEVSRFADPAAIHSAFRTLARRYHPDTGEASSPVKFREAVEAYEILRDPVRRRQHDLDLGLGDTTRKPVAEPLFASRHRTQSQREYLAHSPSTLDDLLFDEMIRLIDSEFEAMLRFF